jgi:O-antigen biosynthesis protein
MGPEGEGRVRRIGGEVPYVDGAETDLLDILRRASDLTSGSDELDGAIHDWPTRYHLSHLRSHLFRPLHLRAGQRVLDVGAGTGAMARYLGEAGCTVVALEGSPARAEVAAERCRDLPEVEVVCGTIDDLDPQERFDVVTVIGVLEYTPAPIGGAGGPAQLLAGVRARLGPSGALVLAIENQLGLKYLLGGAEDHRGAPWVGIEDYPGPPGPRTWSRPELARLLDAAGFTGQTWLAPYPDYKLPTVILHDRAFDEPDIEELVDQLILQPVAFPDHVPARLGDASAAHGALIRAGLGRHVASSLLIVSSTGTGHLDLVADDVLAWIPGGHRRSEWRRERILTTDRRLVVSEPRRSHRAGWLSHEPGDERAFVSGRTLGQEIDSALRAHDLDGVRAVLERWSAELQSRAGPPTTTSTSAPPSPFGPLAGHAVLPADHLDINPGNFVDVDGALVLIDDEWHAEGGVDLELATIRSLWVLAHRIVTSGIAHPWDPAQTVGEVFDDLGELLGRAAAPDLFEQFARAESELQHIVSGAPVDDVHADWLFRGRRGLDNRPDLQLAFEHSQLEVSVQDLARALEAQSAEMEGQGAHYTGLLAERDTDIARMRTLRGWARVRLARSPRIRRLRDRRRARRS